MIDSIDGNVSPCKEALVTAPNNGGSEMNSGESIHTTNLNTSLNGFIQNLPVCTKPNRQVNKLITKTEVKIMYSNIRGLRGKRSSLIEQLSTEKPNFFLLTETLLTSDLDIQIEGYTFFGRSRQGRTGGGVGILVRNDTLNNTIPHVTDRDIEIIWVSYKREKHQPIFIGCYYGKQESRCSKEQIMNEMDRLAEEIQEYKNEGEILIFMDGNGKIGLLGEEKSRNGKLLENTIMANELTFLNKSKKCVGKITRVNSKNSNEKSAIDFVVASDHIEKTLTHMLIDEDGLYRIKGKKETDHNTIIATFQFTASTRQKKVKKTNWNLKAPPLKWENLDQDLECLRPQIMKVFYDKNQINDIYNKWLKLIENSAWKNIGKTTIKTKKNEKFSSTVDQLRKEKRQMKKAINGATNEKEEMIISFKELQSKLNHQILIERASKTKDDLSKIINDKTRNSFWQKRKKLKREPIKDNLTVKDGDGVRQYSPKKIMETMASYYEKLYETKPVREHPAHDKIKNEVTEYANNQDYEDEWYNFAPTENQILEIIEHKKNGKASTDLRNEMLKQAKHGFTTVITPLMKYIWKYEEVPKEWNHGHITSIWKGKGDKESLNCHRGITVSSAIGNILEEIIDKRIESIVDFSQGQAGGKKGSSTADHLFLLRGLMTISIENKQNLFLTFYDVSKAYDNADVNNMLHVMWKNGVRGKLWRILRSMSTNLTAQIKTRYGFSRQIVRENGGRQGSRLTGRLFSKQMDVLSEEFIQKDNLNVKINPNFSIGCFEFVDDVMTCTHGKKNQKEVLLRVDEFAQINKLEWGAEKCQVMQVGRKIKPPETWDLGPKQIKNTTSYKYLGDVITNDGKYKQNIEKRFNQVQAIMRQINTTASSDVMRNIEAKVLLDLYDTCIVPSFLYNAQSWTLTKTDELEMDKLGIQILKRLFNLPEKTPNAAIIHSFGTLYMTQQIDQMKFMYLYKLLKRTDDHWTKKMLLHLDEVKTGWAKNIRQKLTEYNLEQDWSKIMTQSKTTWKNSVKDSVRKSNVQKMINSCMEKDKIKTKTRHIYESTNPTTYSNKAVPEIISSTKMKAKTLILARNGMLECGKNFKGTLPEICQKCLVTDDENHRMNTCPKWKDTNFLESETKISFCNIFSNDSSILPEIIERIQKVWELSLGNGLMKRKP